LRGLKRACKHCKAKFIPKRTDAEFCCNLCRQASYHKRMVVKSAAEEAAVFQKRKAEALVIIDQFERYQSMAGILHAKCRDLGLNNRYMATKIGIMAVKGGHGLDVIGHRLPSELPRWFREIKTRSDSPEVRALLSLPSQFGGSFNARDAEKEFRAVIGSSEPIDVSMFVEDWDHYYATRPVRSSPTNPAPSSYLDTVPGSLAEAMYFAEEVELRGDAAGGWHSEPEWLGDGFEIIDADKV
jgi:hypothetical protein